MTDQNTPDPAPTRDGWEMKYALHERLMSELRPINRGAIFEALDTAGITHVIVRFDGYGDSGQIEDVETKSGETIIDLPSTDVTWETPVWEKSEPERSSITLRDAIENVVYGCLGEAHMGWENNDGAYGEFTFDVADRTITLDYNERYTASEYFQHVF